LLTIGQAVKFNNTIKNQPTKDKYQGKSFKLISWRTLLSVLCMVVVMILLVLWGPDVSDLYLSTGTMAFMISPVVLFARHRLYTAISAGLMLTFFMIITSVPLRDLASQPEYIAPSENDVDVIVLVMLGLVSISPVILLSAAPAKAVSRRLIFLALGLFLLIALNELSKLGLDLTAPKHQG